MGILNVFEIIIVAVVLLWNSFYDWKYRRISIFATVMGIIAVIFFLLFLPDNSIVEIVGGMIIGIFVIIISLFTRGQIGIGDGIICCFIGLSCGFFENLSILFIGLLLSAVTAIVLLVNKRAERGTEIPFVPFLFISYCCMQLFKIF